MRFIEDKEVDLRTVDDFNSLNYSETLVETIKSSPNTPFTIGVFGEWGSGKSSIVKTAQAILENEKKGKYYFFTYDAWKYSKDSFRRTFLLNLAESLELKQNTLFRSFYESRAETMPVKRELNSSLVWLSVILLLVAVGFSVWGQQVWKVWDWPWTFQTVLMAAAIGISFTTNLSKEYIGTRQEPILFSPEQFEECFDEILAKVMKKKSLPEKIKGWFKGEQHKKNIERLVIVFDNIDRCERKVAYELLTDFKNFLGKEQVTFVIPVDDAALRNHVSSINSSNPQEADEFLRKIFNNTIKIKPYKTHDLFDFTSALNKKYELQLNQNTIDVIAKEYATNPRRIIQFLNSLASEKSYLSRRMEGDFVLNNETLIALILLIREEWPELYAKFSDAPYGLRNLDHSLKFAQDHESQQIFLRRTHPHVVNVEDKVLKVIFTNQENFPHVSDSLINALSNRDVKTVQEFVKSSSDGLNNLADYMLQELRDAINRDVLSSLSSAFNNLVFLNKLFTLPEPIYRRILGLVSGRSLIYECITNFDDHEGFAIFLDNLEYQNHFDIQEVVLENLKEYVPKKDESDFAPVTPPAMPESLARLILSMAKYFTSSRLLNSIQPLFFAIYRDKEFNIESLGIHDNNLKKIISSTLVDLIISRQDFQNEEKNKEWLYLVKSGVVSNSQVVSWIDKFLSSHKNFGSVAKENFLSLLKTVNDVLSFRSGKHEGNSLERLADVVLNQRPLNIPGAQGTKNISLMDEVGNDGEAAKILIDLAGHIYCLTSGAGKSDKIFTELANRNDDFEDLVLKKLNELHIKYSFHLSPLHGFLSKRTRISSHLLKIYEWLLERKSKDGTYQLGADEAAEIIGRCVDRLIEKQHTDELVHIFEKWVKDETIKMILANNLAGRDKAVISELPQIIQANAFAHISDGDNIFEYEDNVDLILAMNKQNKGSFNKQIEKVIVGKLMKVETFMDGVDLIEKLDSFKGMKPQYISSLLEEKAEDQDNAERIQACIKKLSG